MRTVDVEPLRMYSGTFDQAAYMLVKMAGHSGGSSIVLHINARNYYFLNKNGDLQDKLRNSTYPLLDGIGLKVAVWFAGRGWQPDLNGTDLFPIVMNMASTRRMRLYLLGGRQEVVARTADVVKNDYPDITVCGYRNGYFTSEEESEVVADIRDCSPDILLVGMGFPRQELFSLKHREHIGAKLIWNVGGLFDFVSDRIPRAPGFLRKIRMEWFFRWLVEPRRLFMRTFFFAPAAAVALVLSNKRRSS